MDRQLIGFAMDKETKTPVELPDDFRQALRETVENQRLLEEEMRGLKAIDRMDCAFRHAARTQPRISPPAHKRRAK